MAAPHPDKLEGGVGLAPPAPGPPPPPPPLPPPPGSLATGPGRKQGKAGLQMKSPEKKRRKSNTQGPSYSHLSEFAPPPTPMVDHLVASNPFEDDFAIPKVGSSSAPFLGNPGPFGNFRMQGAMGPQVPPSYGGGPQPMRRQPPPFGPNQMGPAFNMPPQNPGYVQPGGMGFGGQPFGQPLGQNFSPPGGQIMQGPMGAFGPMMSPTMGQPPRGGDMGSGPALNPPGGPPMAQRFSQPANLFGQSPLQRPNPNLSSLPPNPSPFPGPDPGFPPSAEDSGTGKPLHPPPNSFNQEQHTGSPAAVNGTQPAFPPNSTGHSGPTGTPEGNPLPPTSKAAGNSGHQPPPGLVYPCGACRSEVNDDQDAILCEASCQKWFHRECTGMTENAYGLLTTEASAVWACDFCLKTKEIQSVYIRESMGQLVAANDG
ncbi:PREDICTED: pygopus homolog 2 [Thamnophis sirtalis]|uniref:Pygopus homolog 2 n=2 Tax=Thamnophis TaxID=34999 RepID=A0A6I9WY62_9SAUR|nr:PREDICTED: pygopus homolog 2 [Thamnophis sirtalis]XP_032090250.1 pygopus homolog 2 isoform X1 [Thamnophis elegans]